MRKFITGLLVGLILASTVSVFADSTQTISAVFGKVKLMVDGKAIDRETLLYNGTTYVPLRAAGEALGKEVTYDNNTSTAYLDPPGTGRTFGGDGVYI